MIQARVVAVAWAVLALLVWCSALVSTAQVAPRFLAELWGGTALVAACGLALVHLEAVRPAQVVLALARCWSAQLLVLLGSVYVTPWTGELVDGWMAALDPGGGLAAARWLHTSGAWPLAVAGYNSGQVALVAAVLVAPYPRATRLADAFVIAGLVGLVAYLATPCAGPSLDGAPLGCALSGLPEWAAMRAGSPVVLDGAIPGLISCPSYHAVAATLMARAVWPVRWARPAAVACWAVLVGTAWTVGAHYAPDLVVGVALGEAAWWAAGYDRAKASASSAA